MSHDINSHLLMKRKPCINIEILMRTCFNAFTYARYRAPRKTRANEKQNSCTPDREILRFTPCEKYLSQSRYLTPVALCVQVFLFDIGCIGRHVISSLSARHNDVKTFKFKMADTAIVASF